MGFRPDSLLMFEWVGYIGLGGVVEEFRVFVTPVEVLIPEWMIFSAPNGLWLFSFAGLMVFIWGREQILMASAWTFALWAVAVISEVLQSINFLPGIFDIGDVFAYTVGFLCVFSFDLRVIAK